MNVLGLSYDFHDATVALVRDGALVGVAAEERYSLHKHDHNFPRLALDALMAQHGITLSELDEVAYYEQPGPKYARVLMSGLARFPRGIGSFISANKNWLREKLWVRNTLSLRLRIPPRRLHLVAHHEAHVAQAFLASPFDDAAVLVLDGVGEWDSTTLAVADHRQPGGQRIVERYEYPNSIGLVYAAFTAYLGFKPNSAEASTMALAAYGEPRYVEAMRRILGPQADGSYRVERRYFDFEGDAAHLFAPALVDLLGPPRDIRRPYAFDALVDEAPTADAEDQRCADIAASLQEVLAEVLLGLCRRLRALTASTNLCIAGGVALNCLANTRVAREGGFAQVFVPPDPGDGGAAFGAAMLRASTADTVSPIDHPYLGGAFPADTLAPLLTASPSLDVVLGAARPGVRRAARIELNVIEDEDALLDTVTEALVAGDIVGWFQQRSEIGPRALGNRSLLVDPAQLDAVRRMSTSVKSHTRFRPYALSIADTDAARVLAVESTTQPILRWMQSVWPVRTECRGALRGAIHVDGTTRPQVCSPADNPRYWKLLTRFGRARGIAALLNTSLNERSLPIVAHPRMALAMFARTGIDLLVIDDHLFRKRY